MTAAMAMTLYTLREDHPDCVLKVREEAGASFFLPSGQVITVPLTRAGKTAAWLLREQGLEVIEVTPLS